MTVLLYLIPIALVLGLAALFAFLWSMKSGQFEDMEGNASRILFDDEDEQVTPPALTDETLAIKDDETEKS